MRILLIDDDQVDRARVRRALAASSLEHELVEAADGESGLRLSDAGAFDCVLLDYRLPDIDAFEVLSGLLAGANGNHAVLILTGETDQDLAFRLMRAGALDYLSKAEATAPSLERAIRYALARKAFVAELDAARRDAEAKSRRLDTLNQQKTLLFSIIAHDLRNPFQAILGLAEMLGAGVEGKDLAVVQRRAQGVHRAAAQASRLMESLFAWADLQMDTTVISLGPVHLAEVAAEVVDGASEAAGGKDLNLEVRVGQVRVLAQRDMLVAVLRNLVGNALKFTLPGGTITLSAGGGPDCVVLSVADTGVGMTAEAVAGLFRPERRSTTVGTAGEPGSGLGLIFCQELVERLGGALAVVSTPGAGTTFSFTLPAAPPL